MGEVGDNMHQWLYPIPLIKLGWIINDIVEHQAWLNRHRSPPDIHASTLNQEFSQAIERGENYVLNSSAKFVKTYFELFRTNDRPQKESLAVFAYVLFCDVTEKCRPTIAQCCGTVALALQQEDIVESFIRCRYCLGCLLYRRALILHKDETLHMSARFTGIYAVGQKAMQIGLRASEINDHLIESEKNDQKAGKNKRITTQDATEDVLKIIMDRMKPPKI